MTDRRYRAADCAHNVWHRQGEETWATCALTGKPCSWTGWPCDEFVPGEPLEDRHDDAF